MLGSSLRGYIGGLIDSWCKSLSYNGIIRAQSNSTPAGPYMARLRFFSLLICPSVCPRTLRGPMLFRWRHAYSGVSNARYPSSRQVVRHAHGSWRSAVSSSPETYSEFDYLHLGEIGDATDELIAALDDSVEPPAAQQRFETRERPPLSSFPFPLYDAVPLARYSSARFSSPAVARIGANSATFPPSMVASRASSRPSNFSPSSTFSSPKPIIRR
jgi:hypothetical protein